VLYEIWEPTGDVEFYTLDAISGAKTMVAEVPDTSPASVTGFGVTGRTQFWYTTSDGARHEVVVRKPNGRRRTGR
jgi:hypothetical protein